MKNNKKKDKLKILLTNDDGIHAEGLVKLGLALKKKADVQIVAPDSERSSVGHGITLSKPIFYKEVFYQKKPFGYGVSGTPVDCVKLALHTFINQKPDLIISGINLGPNDGNSVFYSGTVAGAREGALMGIPAIAFSLNTFTAPKFNSAVTQALKILAKIHCLQIPKGTFLNVNIPNIEPNQIKGVKVTRQGLIPIHSRLIKRKDPANNTYYWMTGASPKVKKDLDFDTSALAENYITVTPIQCDTTNYAFYENMRTWKF